jgi:hypothetical protein
MEILARSNARAREKTRLKKIKKWEDANPGEIMPERIKKIKEYSRKIECETGPIMEHIEFISLTALSRINNSNSHDT